MSVTLWQLPISDEHLKSIGWVATSSGLLETAINFAIWSILGLTELQGRALTSNMSAPQRMNSLDSIATARLSDPNQIQKLKSLIKRIGEAQAKRNKLLHAEWGSRDNYWNPPEPRTVTASSASVKKGMLVIGSDTYTAKDIQEMGNEISNVCSDLKILVFNCFLVQRSESRI